jgi:hypothetical protein
MNVCESFMDGHGFCGLGSAKNRMASITLAVGKPNQRRCGDIQVRRQIRESSLGWQDTFTERGELHLMRSHGRDRDISNKYYNPHLLSLGRITQLKLQCLGFGVPISAVPEKPQSALPNAH